MESLRRLRDQVVGYISPSRRRETTAETTPAKLASIQRPTQSLSVRKDFRSRGVISGRVSKKSRPPFDTRRGTPKFRGAERESDCEVEKDEMHNSTNTSELGELGPEDSTSQTMAQDEIVKISSSVNEDLQNDEVMDTASADDDLESGELSLLGSDNESELSPEAKVNMFLDRQSELALQQEVLDIVEEGEWHGDEIALFELLQLRGRRPIFPSHWALDFRAFPARLFTKNLEETSINAQLGSDFRATTALNSILVLGGRVRDLMSIGKPQENLMKKEIQNYVKWSEKDGGYSTKRFLPRLCIVKGTQEEGFRSLSKSVTDQLEFLALKHRQFLALSSPQQVNEGGEVQMFTRTPPVLYGIIIVKCITLFVTLNSADPDAKVRSISHFDFSQKDLDVWNGIAVAMLICVVRNQIMAIRDELEEETEESEEDPDL